MFNNLIQITSVVSTIKHSSSFICASYSIGKLIWTFILNLLYSLLDKILTLVWYIVEFVLEVMEMLEYIVREFLGIGSSVNDFATYITNAQELEAGETNFLNVLIETFRAILGVSIFLLLLFSIVAIIRQEWTFANGNSQSNGEKGKFLTSVAIKCLSMFMLPIMVMFVFMGVSSILTSFNNALTSNKSSIAGQVLAASLYDSNRYRTYANSNSRIPIIIEYYDVDDYDESENSLLVNKITASRTQINLKNTATILATGQNISFGESITYSNNQISSNSSSYSDYYESFICTAEQYQVMADFIDYVELAGLTYYIKAVGESDIEWKYVSSTVFDEDDLTLTVDYVDSTDMNSDGSTDDTYQIVYATSYEVTTPMSNALESIMAMLGIGEYEDDVFKIMERDENSTNIVEWSTRKVLVKFSDGIDLTNPDTWTSTDEIILYEYYHYSSNNSLGDYTITELIETGAELDLYEISYNIVLSTGAYSDENVMYAVYLNGSYYPVVESETLKDGYGSAYYVLASEDSILEDDYIAIKDTDSTYTLKLSTYFNINDTTSWTYSDQILIYEYFSDLTYNNDLSKYSFDDFYSDNGGVALEKYSITSTTGSSSEYVLINGTYYSTSVLNYASSQYYGNTFLSTLSDSKIYYNYSYSGIDISEYIETSNDVYDETDSDGNSYKLSSSFTYSDTTTWTKKDYILFYLYANYGVTKSLSILQTVGLSGTYCTKEDGEGKTYIYMRFNNNSTSGDDYLYVNLTKLSDSSLDDNIYAVLDYNETFNNMYNTYFTYNNENLFISSSSLEETVGDEGSVTEISTAAYTYNFSFSYNFSIEDITSWKVGDMILVVLSYAGIIGDVENIEGSGYDALVYTDGSSLYYKFGSGSRAVYLSESAIQEIGKKLGYNIETTTTTKIGDSFTYQTTSKTDAITLSTFLNFSLSGYMSIIIGGISEETITGKVTVTFDSDYNVTFDEVDNTFDTLSKSEQNKIEDSLSEYAEENDKAGLSETISYSISRTVIPTISDYVILVSDVDEYIELNGLESYTQSETSYEYVPNTTNSFLDDYFTTFDYFVCYAQGISYQYKFSSYVYTISSGDYAGEYVKVGNYFIKISELEDYVSYSDSSLTASTSFATTISYGTLFVGSTGLTTAVDTTNTSVIVYTHSSSYDATSYTTWTVFDFLQNCFTLDTYTSGSYKYLKDKYIVVEDKYGNSKVYHVVGASKLDSITSSSIDSNMDYFNYDVLVSLVNTKLNSSVIVTKLTGESVSLQISNSTASGDFTYEIIYDTSSVAFSFDQYYYFLTDTTALSGLNIFNSEADASIVKKIDEATKYDYSINLKLSSAYSGVTPDSFTLASETDYVYINDGSGKYWKYYSENYSNSSLAGTLYTTGEEGSEVSYYYLYDSSSKKYIEYDSTGKATSNTTNYYYYSFDIYNPDTWTLLDFLVLYEFSRTVKLNYFDGFTYSGLTVDTFELVYVGNSGIILALNGNYYSIPLEYITILTFGTNTYCTTNVLIKDLLEEYNNKLTEEGSTDTAEYIVSTSATSSNYSMKILYNTIQYSYTAAATTYSNNVTIFEPAANSNVLVYNPFEKSNGEYVANTSIRIYRNLNTLNKSAIQINTKNSSWTNVTISTVVREVNWPQKLMNDIQVIYPDLNWSTLIATDGWLDTLGDFSSTYASGEYLTDGNSANITAAGLVLSEFFLSRAKSSTSGYADYEYESVYDEDTLNALMLAMLGEDDYEAVSLAAEVYTDLFNTSFASIIEEIAEYYGYDVVEGKVDNIYLSVYKAYLTTILLSSDVGEWLYTVATRVYAQYTVYEYLASAAGDYGTYYSYINGSVDENGDEITAFSYGSFYELVMYENQNIGTSAPTFSFNLVNVVKKVYTLNREQYSSDSEWEDSAAYKYYFKNLMTACGVSDISSLTYEKVYNYYSNNESAFYSLVTGKISVTILGVGFTYTMTGYDSYYESSHKGIQDNDGTYCFAFDCYYSLIDQYESLGYKQNSMPVYLSLFYDYLTGDIARWEMLDDVSIDGASSYIQYYSNYTSSMTTSKFGTFIYAIAIFTGTVDNTLDIDNIVDIVSAITNAAESSAIAIIESDLSSKYQSDIDTISSLDNIINLISYMSASENGDMYAWNWLLDYQESLSNIMEEFSDLIDASVGDTTENGSTKTGKYSDNQYESAYSKLSNLQYYIDTYISSQKMVDKITKTCVTYAYSIYGSNYVSDGYSFVIDNRDYTLTSSVAPLRLAEYVYGGSFLASYGVEPVYTSEDFDGIIEVTRKYDSSSNSVKKYLNAWVDLREFATKVADYTAKLYYMTNLNDISNNIDDSVKLSDTIRESTGNGSYNAKSLETMILEYLASGDAPIDSTTLAMLTFSGTTSSLSVGDAGYTIAVYLEDQYASISEEEMQSELTAYLTSSSTNDTSTQFANVMQYLLVSDGEEGVSYDFDNMTLGEFKQIIIARLSDYVANPTETGSQNTGRYLTLFYLLCCQIDCYDVDDYASKDSDYQNEHYIGRTVPSTYNGYVYATFSIDTQTKNTILELAGLTNRPIEDLVGLEYDDLYDVNGNYDEAYGDTFVVCFYDEIIGKYVPYMCSGTGYSWSSSGTESNEYRTTYGNYFTSSYISSDNAYPVIAKGAITSQGYPTAIKMEDYEVVFYRTNISVAASVDDSAISYTKAVSETTSVGFTNYTSTTTFSSVSSANSSTMYIGSSDLAYFVNSSGTVYYLQQTAEYNYSASDGSYMVLDNISAYYKFTFITYFLLALGIAAVLPLLFRATMVAMRRILDLILLILMGPPVLALSVLDIGKDKAESKKTSYAKWVKALRDTLLQAFGLIISFNIYYIMISTISNMTIVSETTFSKIKAIADLPFLTTATGLINAILKGMVYLTAAGLLRSGGDMLSNIIYQGGSPYVPAATNAIGTKEGEVFDSVKGVVNDTKNFAGSVRDVVSGQKLIEARDAAIETGLNMIPGKELMGAAAVGTAKVGTYVTTKTLEGVLRANGMNKKDAKDKTKKLREAINKKIDHKRQHMQDRKDARQVNAQKFFNGNGAGKQKKGKKNP